MKAATVHLDYDPATVPKVEHGAWFTSVEFGDEVMLTIADGCAADAASVFERLAAELRAVDAYVEKDRAENARSAAEAFG
jgi:hypothetical protein